MARKVMDLKQIAAAYGVDYRTLRSDMLKIDHLYDELDAAGYGGRKFYPIHQALMEKYFGIIPKL